MCDAIYIGKKQQTIKKIMDGHLSNLLRLLKNGQKSYSFSTHFEHHFNAIMLCTDLYNYMTFKLLKKINQIGAMETFTKTNCNICMEVGLTILNNIT